MIAAKLAVLSAICAITPLSCVAHAILIDSDPAPRAQVAPGPVSVTLDYNSRIDRERSRLTLVAADRSQTPLAIGVGGAANTLTTRFDATPGAWVIRWQVLALDGHITRGDVPLTVAAKP